MTEAVEFAKGLGLSWAIFGPVGLVTLAALAWGRTSLPRVDMARALAWTVGVSFLVGFPIAWAVYAYCAGFNPEPKSSAAHTGLRFAAGLIPLYGIFVAGIVFGLADQSALERGASPRPVGVRLLAQLVIAVGGFIAVGMVLGACFLAAGPRVFG